MTNSVHNSRKVEEQNYSDQEARHEFQDKVSSTDLAARRSGRVGCGSGAVGTTEKGERGGGTRFGG